MRVADASEAEDKLGERWALKLDKQPCYWQAQEGSTMEDMKRHIEQELSLRTGSYYLKARNKEGRWAVISQDVSLEALSSWVQEREVAIEGRVKGGTPKKDPTKAREALVKA